MPFTWILIVIGGALLGWLAAVILAVQTGRDVLGLIGTGIVGALIGAFLITPTFAGRLALYGFSMPGLLISLLGAILLLGLVGMVHRRRGRRGPPSGA